MTPWILRRRCEVTEEDGPQSRHTVPEQIRTTIPNQRAIDEEACREPSIGLDFVTLADKLEELIGHKIDLVSRRAIKPLLWKKIERELIDV